MMTTADGHIAYPTKPQRMAADEHHDEAANSLAESGPGKALFLAGLSEACEFTDLHQYFEQYGQVVLCRVLKDAKTGRSRRVGYVNFTSADDAVRAMNGLQGKPGPGGAPFDIKIAAQDPTFKAQETRKVFVRYVPLHVTTEQMRSAFGQFGDIEDCIVTRDLSRTARREPGPWNMAYVTYKNTRDAVRAVAEAARTIRFGEQELTVKPAVSEETLRLRSKTRQQAAKQQRSAGGTPNGAAAGGPPPGAITAPPGMVPVMIPGVGLAFMPMQQMQMQMQMMQQAPVQAMTAQQQYLPQHQYPPQPQYAQQAHPQFQQYQPMAEHQQYQPQQHQPQYQSLFQSSFQAAQGNLSAPRNASVVASAGADDYAAAFAPCAADQHLHGSEGSARDSPDSQPQSVFFASKGGNTSNYNLPAAAPSPGAPQWMQ